MSTPQWEADGISTLGNALLKRSVPSSFFFEHVDDRGRTDLQDTDDISHTTAIERHVDALLFHSRQPPFVVVVYEKNAARTVGIVAARALGPMRLFPLLHPIGTVTIGTLPLHQSHGMSPTKRCGIGAQCYQGINCMRPSNNRAVRERQMHAL
jgi:hypothetical protein